MLDSYFTCVYFTLVNKKKFIFHNLTFHRIFFLRINLIVGREIEKGGIYKGVITSIKEYGAFVEFNGGQHGLLHISELSHEPVCTFVPSSVHIFVCMQSSYRDLLL